MYKTGLHQMKKADIERIIAQGSVKQKIKLYFTDVAHYNIVGRVTATLSDSGATIQLDAKDEILTDSQRSLIFNSIKEPKDKKYWEDLRKRNKAFLIFKPEISAYRNVFSYLRALLSKQGLAALLHQQYEEAINDMLDIVEEESLRERLVEKALESLQIFRAKKYQEEGFLPGIVIKEVNTRQEIITLVKIVNEQIKEAKDYIGGIKIYLAKELPLQPYKQFVKEEEAMIQAELQECRRIIKLFLLRTLGSPTQIGDELIQIAKELNVPIERLEPYKIVNWEEVEAEVTDEDIEDIKNAGR